MDFKRNQNRNKSKKKQSNVQALVRRLRSPDDAIAIRLSGLITVTASAGGVVATSIPCNPNSGGLNDTEYTTYWTQIYSQVKVLEFRVRFTPVSFLPTSQPVNSCCGSLLTLSTPTNHNDVLDNADGRLIQIYYDGRNPQLTLRFNDADLDYATVGSETTVQNLGCPGSVSFYGTGHVATVVAIAYQYEGIYLMRNRI